ncbi:MAG: hypothetical protein DRI88_03940, partial [Bacteroidetes bacterium]
MKNARLFIMFLLLFYMGTANAQNNDIGDTIHAIHYNIHLNHINTAENTIAAYTEIKLVPLIEDLAYIPLE